MRRTSAFHQPETRDPDLRLSKSDNIGNYTMAERAQRPYFGIHNESDSLPNPVPHRHEYFQIYVNLDGHTTHYLGYGQRPVEPGTLCFIAPLLPHYLPNPEDARFYVINASKSFLFPGIDFDPLEFDSSLLARIPELGPFLTQDRIDFVFEGRDVDEIDGLCQRMMREAAHDDVASRMLVRGHLLNLLGLVWRQYASEMMAHQCDTGGRRNGRHVMSRLARYIASNLDKEITLSSAAGACHLSPTHLAHLIKRETGQTFLQIVTDRRIELAKSYLVFSNLSVKEICALTGFTDTSHFARRFKQITGQSPSDYKLLHQKGIGK